MKGRNELSDEKDLSHARNALSDPRFTGFLHNVNTILDEENSEERITARVASSLADLLSQPLKIPNPYRTPRDDRYIMYPLYVAPGDRFSVAAAVWDVGQATPVHDHSVWGVVGIVEGVEREIRYAKPRNGSESPLIRLPDGEFGPGEVTICCTSDADIHAVSCASDVPCVGLHVYGGNIGTIRRRTYRPDGGEVGYFTSSWPDIPPAVVEI